MKTECDENCTSNTSQPGKEDRLTQRKIVLGNMAAQLVPSSAKPIGSRVCGLLWDQFLFQVALALAITALMPLTALACISCSCPTEPANGGHKAHNCCRLVSPV